MITNPVFEFTDQNGRVNYNNLVKHIKKTRLDYFIKSNTRPFLVGKELYDGLLMKEGIANAKTQPITRASIVDDTAFFKMLAEQKMSKKNNSQSITRAIFAIKKKPFSKELSDTIIVGRNSECDMVIADYSISRAHAKIIIHYNKYYVEDTGSTNGSFLDGEELPENTRREIPIGGVLAFGRIGFMLMCPEDLYHMLEND